MNEKNTEYINIDEERRKLLSWYVVQSNEFVRTLSYRTQKIVDTTNELLEKEDDSEMLGITQAALLALLKNLNRFMEAYEDLEREFGERMRGYDMEESE